LATRLCVFTNKNMPLIYITNLLANMVVIGTTSIIQTNTQQFQDYAFLEMFSHATNMITSWNLDFPRPIATNAVTDFKAVAYPGGVGGNIVLSNRFYFQWLYGGLPIFNDRTYSSSRISTPDVEKNDAILEQWMNTTNLLTMEKAQQIAESAMKSVGLPLDKLGFKRPKEAHQRKYEWKDGKDYPLPYYQFRWETEEDACTVDVSGITGKVAYFGFSGYPYLRFEKPTDYFEMLGLPTNAVFVHRTFTPPGKPPLYELRE
jgi:hypothetical protein